MDREGFPHNSVGKESACNAGDPHSVQEDPHWRTGRLPTPVFLGFPCGSTGKEYAYKVGDLGSIPGLGRSPPLQYSGLENSMDCIVDGVAKSRTRLSDFHFHRENNSGRRRDFPLRYKTIKQTKTTGLLHTVSQLKQSKCESGKKKTKPYSGLLTANQVNVSSFLIRSSLPSNLCHFCIFSIYYYEVII